MASGMNLQGVPQTMPIVVPVSHQQPQPQQQQQHVYQANHNEVGIQRKLEEQERKLAERQAELAKLADKLDTLKREQQQQQLEQKQQQQLEKQRKQQQQLEQERKEQQQQQQYEQQQQQYQQQQQNATQTQQEHPQHSQSARPTQHSPPTKTPSWTQSNGSDYLSTKSSRFSSHPLHTGHSSNLQHTGHSSHFLHTGHSSSFLKQKSDVLPPSEFRDRHPIPPSQPTRNTTVSATPPPPVVNVEYVDGPILKSKPDGGAASVVLAVHTQRPSPHAPTKIYHMPNHGELATASFTVVMTEKGGRTELYRKCTGPYLTYQNVKWKLFLRKEVHRRTNILYDLGMQAQQSIHYFK